MGDVILRWESPGPVTRNRWAAIVEELDAHPGQWAVVGERLDEREANNVNSGLRHYANVSCAIRKQPTGGWTVYARSGGSSQLALVTDPPGAVADC